MYFLFNFIWISFYYLSWCIYIGESEGSWAGGERGEAHDGGEGVQAEGQASAVWAGEQCRWNQGREYGRSQGNLFI